MFYKLNTHMTETVATQQSSSPTSTEGGFGYEPFEINNNTPFSQGIQLMLVSPADKQRAEIEQFIARGYQEHFKADLVEFAPVILVVKDFISNRILGAVGLRYADENQLFSEKYLSQPIESVISECEHDEVLRNDLIELSHFIVDQSSDINVVIPAVAKFLKSLDVKWAIYTLSRPIKVAFNKMGIKLTHLQHAHPEALSDYKTNWGNYYDFKPAVYYSDILNNLNSLD